MSRYRNDRDDRYGDDRYGRERGGGSSGGSDRDERLRRNAYRDGEDYSGRENFRHDDASSFAPRERERGWGGDFRRDEYDGRGRYGGGNDPRDERPDDFGRGGTAREYYGERSRPREERYEDYRYVERPTERMIERRPPARSRLRCRDIMTRDVTVAMRETTLHEVAAMMRDDDTGVIPVIEQTGGDAEATSISSGVHSDYGRGSSSGSGGVGRRGQGKLVGLITDRDIVLRAVAEGKDSRLVRVEEVMTSDVHTAQPNDRVIDVIRQMGDKQVRRIPVVDNDGNLRGIISMADIALETEEDRELANALEEISSGSSFWSKLYG
ncbi:MAG: CBS domain-containing protein [Pyrinomonadaceae bacterium]